MSVTKVAHAMRLPCKTINGPPLVIDREVKIGTLQCQWPQLARQRLVVLTR